MIEKYKNISIIYGGSGGEYARTLNKMINEYEKENRYPISSRIVMEQILTEDILTQVVALFKETEICVAFLTAEDCCVDGDKKKLRLRQNVVFELGMALFHLGREKCILLGDFESVNNVELPSDMFGLDIKFFDKNNQTEIFTGVLNKVLQISNSDSSSDKAKKEIVKHDNLLRRSRYFIDYALLFRRYDKILSSSGKGDLRELLQTWIEECKNLKYFDEKLMYVLERIAFMPIFGKQSALSNWYISIEDVVGEYDESDIDYYGGTALLKYAKTVFNAVNNYTKYKMVDGFKPTLSDYEELLSDLKFNKPPKGETINPLIDVLYYDYMGLIYMHVYSFTKEKELMFKAKECYEKIVNEYLDKVDLSLSVWGGFLYFNLARVYAKILAESPSDMDGETVLETFERAIAVRKKWLTATGFNSMIQNAMSYEYFIAKIEYVHQMKVLNAKSAMQIDAEYKKLEGEIESYCNNDEKLERLIFVQEMLNKYRAK